MPLIFPNHPTDFFSLFPTFFGNVGVKLCRFAALVPEQLLNVTQVRAFLREVCGKRVTQGVSSRQRVDARPLPGGLKNVQQYGYCDRQKKGGSKVCVASLPLFY
jgi:hypothetical protein